MPIVDVTNVNWDLEDFPVPEGRCVESFRENITKVLEGLGYCGHIRNVLGYPSYDKMSMEVDEHFRGGRILLFENRKTKYERLMSMLINMISFARDRGTHHHEEYNFIVIAKDAPDAGDETFVTALETLMDLGCNVFLAVPDGLPLSEMPPTTMARRVWYWSDLFDGKSPIQRIGGEPDVVPRQTLDDEQPTSDGDTCDFSDSDGDSSDFSDSDSVDGFPIKRRKKGCCLMRT